MALPLFTADRNRTIINLEIVGHLPSKKQRQMGQTTSEFSSSTTSRPATRFPFSMTTKIISSDLRKSEKKQPRPNVVIEEFPQRSKLVESKPIDIEPFCKQTQQNDELFFIPRFNTAPPELLNHLKIIKDRISENASNKQCDVLDERYTDEDANGNHIKHNNTQQQARIILPRKPATFGIKNPVISKCGHGHDLSLCREWILNQKDIRRNDSTSGEQDLVEDKENDRLAMTDEKQSKSQHQQSRKRLNSSDYTASEGPSRQYNDQLENSESDVEKTGRIESLEMPTNTKKPATIISRMDTSEEWEATECDDELFIEEDSYCLISATPRSFSSVGDIIGYAKVIRAQRDETLGRLNNALSGFSAAWDCMRRAMEDEVRMRQGGVAQVNEIMNGAFDAAAVH